MIKDFIYVSKTYRKLGKQNPEFRQQEQTYDVLVTRPKLMLVYLRFPFFGGRIYNITFWVSLRHLRVATRRFFVLSCRNGRADNRVAASDNIPLENDWTYNAAIYSEVSFDNPGFNENPVYDSLSLCNGRTIQENIKQANNDAMQELGFTDLPNGIKIGEERHGSYQSLEVNARSNPMFGIPYSGDSRTDESGERYCVLTGGEEEEACASLRNEGTNHLQDKNEYLKLAEPQIQGFS